MRRSWFGAGRREPEVAKIGRPPISQISSDEGVSDWPTSMSEIGLPSSGSVSIPRESDYQIPIQKAVSRSPILR
jgi:hypothetical protein